MKRFLKKGLAIALCLAMLIPMSSQIFTFEVKAAEVEQADLDKLGYGFNVAEGKPLEQQYLKNGAKILDMKSPELLASIVSLDYGSTVNAKSVSATSSREMSELIETGFGVGANISIPIQVITASADIDYLFGRSSLSAQTKQEYYDCYYQTILRRGVLIQMPINQLKNHLDSQFIEAATSVNDAASAAAFFRMKG